jgi:general secretion pathway protein K
MSARGESGFVLVAALWMLTALATLTLAYAAFVRRTAPEAAAPEDRLRAEAALRAGVALCAFAELDQPKPARPDLGTLSARVGDARIDIRFRTENARLDLNDAPKEALSGLFAQLGAGAETAEFLAERIVAWRAKLKPEERAREAAIYRKAGLAYAPLGAPFDNALEISRLPGVTPALARAALPYLTVFGGAKIDPLAADPLVLSATPGMTAAAAAAFRAAQGGRRPDAQTIQSMAGAAKDYVAADTGDYVRADIAATISQRAVHAEVVLKIVEGAASPYEIMFWRDDFDGAGE